MNATTTTKPKTLSGVVVSNKMQDTLVVAVSRYVKHAKYLKFQKLVKRYHVHAPGVEKEIGDKVEIRECRPISKKKHFVIVQNP